MIASISSARRATPAALMLAVVSLSSPLHADPNNYQVSNLVSDGGVPAMHRDDNLKNGWGVAFNPTGFVWVADNGSGRATLYEGNGVPQSLVVTIPAADPAADHGTPTGITFSASNSDFMVSANGALAPARFIFVSEDGMVSGWAPSVDGTHAIKAWVNPDAVYKGVAIAGNGEREMLYAADFRNRKIDVYDATFHPASVAGGFADRNIPSDYGPFNVMNIQGNLYVAYAKKDPNSDDEMKGAGFGFVDVFDADGNLLKRLARRGSLNAPWGMALAPAGFGPFSNRVLVGNFGDGAISAFDAHTGKFKGQLRANGKVVKIDGLWGIAFGNGIQHQPTATLFFAAGPNDEANGLYGRIDAVSPASGDDEDDGED
jgi:uncharacterized protein (TIGR03118 family)